MSKSQAKITKLIGLLTLAAGAAVFVLRGLLPNRDPFSSSSSPSSSNRRATL